LQVSGLDEVEVKEFGVVDDELMIPDDANVPEGKKSSWRRWRVVLGDYVQGTVRLQISFQQSLPESRADGLPLPLLRADANTVTYQSGLLAVETSGDIDAQLNLPLEGRSRVRKIDKGELAEADHEVGKRMLGAFGFLGVPPQGTIDLVRR
jgi:hypothetical protein